MSQRHDVPDAVRRAYGLFKGGTETGDDVPEDDEPWSVPQARTVLDVVSTARTRNGGVLAFLTKDYDDDEMPEIVADVVERCGLEEDDREYWTDGTLKRVRFEPA